MIEAHPDPENALSDGHQSLYSAKDPANPMGLSKVIEDVRRYYDFRLKMTGVG
jgi:3-deoxy-D-arabino-heptulosonate 7-phosphate (DAHP) synthase